MLHTSTATDTAAPLALGPLARLRADPPRHRLPVRDVDRAALAGAAGRSTWD